MRSTLRYQHTHMRSTTGNVVSTASFLAQRSVSRVSVGNGQAGVVISNILLRSYESVTLPLSTACTYATSQNNATSARQNGRHRVAITLVRQQSSRH